MSTEQPTPTAPLSGSYRELFAIAFPLILTTSSLSLMHLVDRMFLSWYSADDLAACASSGALAFLFISVFSGTAGYVSTFIAQYDGAGHPKKIGAVFWQGIHFSALATVILMLLSFAAPAFRWLNHEPGMLRGEIIYFRVLLLGAGGEVFSAALSAFYNGRGKTWTVLWTNIAAVMLNALLAWLLILGPGPFPEWGILGAGLATNAAVWFKTFVYIVLIFRPREIRSFRLDVWRFNLALFTRLMRFGVPSALQITIDVAVYTIFILFLGTLGKVELAASTIVFSVNGLLFMPVIGLSIACSIMVGRYQGALQPEIAAQATRRCLVAAVAYMLAGSIIVALYPGMFIKWFTPADATQFEEIGRLATTLLYFVAAYSVVDAVCLTYSAALKGAGDTRFVLIMVGILAPLVLLAPTYVACFVFDGGIYAAWYIITFYIFVLALAYWLRFRAGKWRSMRVIEHVPVVETVKQEGPLVEV